MVLLSGVVVILALVTLYPTLVAPSESQTDSEGEGLVFTTVDGEIIAFEDLFSEGKGVLIYFFATWCPTCEEDLQNLNSVYGEKDWKINVIVVAFDPSESNEQIAEYKEKRGYSWPFAEYNSDVILKFGITSQASKVTIYNTGEVASIQGYGLVTKKQWRELLSEVEP
jgi:thiol-disulfide isomerase/thioredoxin